MFAISFPADRPTKPGLVRVHEGGYAFPVEVWQLPVISVGALLQKVPEPLALGTVQLEDQQTAFGFICEGYVASLDTGVRDISHFGSWKAFKEHQAQGN